MGARGQGKGITRDLGTRDQGITRHGIAWHRMASHGITRQADTDPKAGESRARSCTWKSGLEPLPGDADTDANALTFVQVGG